MTDDLQPMLGDRAKVLTSHADDCPGIEHVRKGWWDHSWFIQETVHRDAIGRRQAGTWRWFRLLCNTSNFFPCPAEAIVREDVVTDALSEMKV